MANSRYAVNLISRDSCFINVIVSSLKQSETDYRTSETDYRTSETDYRTSETDYRTSETLSTQGLKCC